VLFFVGKQVNNYTLLVCASVYFALKSVTVRLIKHSQRVLIQWSRTDVVNTLTLYSSRNMLLCTWYGICTEVYW